MSLCHRGTTFSDSDESPQGRTSVAKCRQPLAPLQVFVAHLVSLWIRVSVCVCILLCSEHIIHIFKKQIPPLYVLHFKKKRAYRVIDIVYRIKPILHPTLPVDTVHIYALSPKANVWKSVRAYARKVNFATEEQPFSTLKNLLKVAPPYTKSTHSFSHI